MSISGPGSEHDDGEWLGVLSIFVLPSQMTNARGGCVF